MDAAQPERSQKVKYHQWPHGRRILSAPRRFSLKGMGFSPYVKRSEMNLGFTGC
jgi:hypothetical protein